MSKQHQIQINLPGLLRILGENIYAEPDVAIREMIQNAHDTCIIRGAEDGSFTDAQIHVSVDKGHRTITISDNGQGMSEAELHKNLATIGESFTRIQREQLRDKDAQKAALLIGQFGIGLLSAFSISRRVEVITRSCQGYGAFRWVCDGDIQYSVEPCTKPDPGTRVVLHLLDSKQELLDEGHLRRAIKKYADFLSIPILLNGDQANVCTPPWETGHADLSEYILSRWGLSPIGVIPFNTKETKAKQPVPCVSGLLFIPLIPYELTRNFGEVDIYISRMFIKANDKELLPRWASFVKGVIDTSELTPTLSRGEIIADEACQRVRGLLGAVVIDYLGMLEQEDPDKLTLLVRTYNNTIKARALEDDDFFDRICDLVRLSTDRGPLPSREYLEESKGVLYYFSERGSGTQHKVLFAHKGLPVIDASWGVEEEFLKRYAERRGVPIERLAADSEALFTTPSSLSEKWKALELDFYQHIHKATRAVEFEPETVPTVLLARPLDTADKQLSELHILDEQHGLGVEAIRRMFREREKERNRYEADDDVILHINTRNPLIQQLRDMPRNDTFYLALACLYNNAAMFAQHYVSPKDAEIIFTSNNNALLTMIATAQALSTEQQERAKAESELERLKRRLADLSLARYRTCFFAFDYKIDDNYRLLEAIQAYYDRKGLGIKVMAPAKAISDLNIHRDLHRQLKQAHFGIAEVSNNNLNVLYEAGLLHGMAKPLVLLQRTDSTDSPPFDIFSDYRCKYQVSRREAVVRFIWLDEELDKAMAAVMQMLPDFDKVPKWERD